MSRRYSLLLFVTSPVINTEASSEMYREAFSRFFRRGFGQILRSFHKSGPKPRLTCENFLKFGCKLVQSKAT